MPSPLSPPAASRDSSRGVLLAGLALLLLAFAAYANTFGVPFLYDDIPSLVENPTLENLRAALSPPGGNFTVSGRPVLNLSFALNRALGGGTPQSYHAGNLLLHALAGLVLFGLVRRAVSLPAFRPRLSARDGVLVAVAIAALWTLHPLQTESVTYLVQRAESLMGLFYLLTIYFFLRSAASNAPVRWQTLAFVACLLGMATKENMASAPIVVLLLDRALVGGSFRAAWRAHRRFYFALAATWLPLAALVLHTGGNRGGSAGFGVGVSPVHYWLTQFPALVRYVALTFWPHPLVFDYGTFWITRFSEVFAPTCIVVALIAATFYALVRAPLPGALGAFFFAILAPTSIMPGTTQMIVEHRMYLPLLALLAIGFGATHRIVGRHAILAGCAAALALGWCTLRRNVDYRSDLALWQDTLAKCPTNATAHCALGNALGTRDRNADAIAEYRRALQLRPDYLEALTNLGDALTQSGHPADALPLLERAVLIQPAHAEAHLNLGVALDFLGRSDLALQHYRTALHLKPQLPAGHDALGNALLRRHETAAAIAEFDAALRLDPQLAAPHYNLAVAFAQSGRADDAQKQFDLAVQRRPQDTAARLTWANTLLELGRAADAIAAYEAVLKIRPDYSDAHYNLANALAGARRYDDAIAHYTEALRLAPDSARAENNLGNALTMLHRDAEAVPHYEASLRLRPADASAENNLGLALARLGRVREALPHFEAAVRLAPDFADARENLARARSQVDALPSP
ncbi:MAG TPA: tetratricopeptide repeat protein [Opitutaceae bacterium]|nr:tetratricopeptide repeat protein [Opitutaceae bacterium]